MTSSRPAFDEFLRWTCDGFVVVFGLWSVLSQAVSLLGGSALLLGRLSLGVPFLAAAVLFLIGRSSGRVRSRENCGASLVPSPDKPTPHFPALAGAAVLTAFYALTTSYVVFWAASCLFLGYFFLSSIKAPPIRLNRADLPAPAVSDLAVLAFLAVVVMGATLFVHRMQYDDSLYLSVAVDVLDNPGAPLMRRDTMHGIPGLPFIAPQHRPRTYDVLVGLTARLLGIKPIAAAHLLFPPLFALIFLAAAARFLRLLLGRAWLFGLVAVVVLLLINGDTESSYGNSAFVLLFQGKAILPTVMVPLLAAYGMEFMSGLRSSLVTGGLIGLGLASGLALSTNGLFVGPITAGLAIAAAWRPDRKSTVRLIWVALACLIPIALGVFLRTRTVPTYFYAVNAAANSWLYQTMRSMNLVWGWLAFQCFWFMAFLGGWVFIPDRARRRWMLGYSWLFLLLFMNPFLSGFWARNLTSSITLFRLYWAIPLPFFLAALLTGPLFSASRPWKSGTRAALSALALLSFALFVPAQWTISPGNSATLDWPRLKVLPTFYRVAEQLSALTPPGGMVLAPEPVSSWIPTIPGHPPAVIVRRLFLDQFKSRMDPAEFLRRLTLFEYISGDQRSLPRPEMDAYFGAAIDDLKIRSVAVLRSNPWLSDIEIFLRGRGFRRIPSLSRHFLIYLYNEARLEKGIREGRR